MPSLSLDSPKILIADDDAATRLLLRAAMMQWGYEVIEAENGEEAWDVLQKPNPPQILTLDWLMPKLDGLSLCQRIEKELDYHPYIIFLTRMKGAKNVMQGLEAGADEFILKPFDLNDLRTRVFAGERIIKYRRQMDKAANLLQNASEIFKEMNSSIPDQEMQKQISEFQNQWNQFNETWRTRFVINPSSIVLKPSEKKRHINMERMQAFFGDNKAAIREFINSFISLSVKQLDQIKEAISHKNSETLKYYFHLLGGASANSGIMKVSEYCEKGERSSETDDWSTAEECYQQLMIVIEELKVENA